MKVAPLDAARARDLIASFPGLLVLVVGDLMLDRFVVGRVSRISPEGSIAVVQFQPSTRLAARPTWPQHHRARRPRLARRGRLAGTPGGAARQELSRAGTDTDGLVEDGSRPTTEKVRIVTERNQQVARVDYEQDGDVSGQLEQEIIERIRRLGNGAKALLVSDYLKGAVTRRVIEALIELKNGGAPLVVDPKIPHLTYYAGATIITPNHGEAEAATHRRIRSDEEAHEAALDFRARAACKGVLITRGEQGMCLLDPGGEGAIPSIAHEVSDVTGAGDTVAATLALALAAGATMREAAILANYAAGLVVGKFGPATVTPQELAGSFAN
jgi:D-beta-D-heptose 7-phosphate kinase/D-beta-D-heptose 1-phosphate adenosyltransferase